MARLSSREASAFPRVHGDVALEHARAADDRRRSGLPLPSLNGVPVVVAQALEAGKPTNGGPARHELISAPVAAMRAAGAVVVAIAADPQGCAAAVGEGCVPAAIGLDCAGSLLAAAAQAGCFGFKPSFGLVPRSHTRLVAPSLDAMGVLSRSIADLAVVTEAIQAYDSGDPATASRIRPPLLATATMDWPLPPRFAFVPGALKDAAQREAFGELLEALGEDAMTIDIETLLAQGEKAFDGINGFELAGYHGSSADGARAGHASVSGMAISAEAQARALEARAKFHAILRGVFSDHGTILTHARSNSAGLPEKLWAYLGLPTLSVPLLECDGQPIGVLLVCASGDDGRLLRSARLVSERIARLA